MAGETTTWPKAAATYPANTPLSSTGAEIEATATIPTTGLELADVHQMIRVPKGARVTGGSLTADDMDSGTALVLAVGDGVDDDRYVTGSTIGQAGGVVQFGRTASLSDYTYPAEDTIDIKVTTAAGTAVSGKIKLVVRYVVERS
jgi:hypothetical protein